LDVNPNSAEEPKLLANAGAAQFKQWNVERLKYNQRALDLLVAFDKSKPRKAFNVTVGEAINALREMLTHLEIITGAKSLDDIRVELLTSAAMKSLIPWKDSVALGSCNVATNHISIHDHLLLAPKKLIRNVMIHEALHLAHAICFAGAPPQRLEIDEDVAREYPPVMWEEEQWVRNMEKELNGNKYIAEMWGFAVSHGKARWCKLFYELKKQFRNDNKK